MCSTPQSTTPLPCRPSCVRVQPRAYPWTWLREITGMDMMAMGYPYSRDELYTHNRCQVDLPAAVDVMRRASIQTAYISLNCGPFGSRPECSLFDKPQREKRREHNTAHGVHGVHQHEVVPEHPAYILHVHVLWSVFGHSLGSLCGSLGGALEDTSAFHHM